MSRIPLRLPPGVVTDDTDFLIGDSAWAYVDKVRFWRGQPQTIGGWEAFSAEPINGATRTVFAWTNTQGDLNVAFGSNAGLFLSYGGGQYDITPLTFIPGNVDGTGGRGYGTGAYSVGAYSEPSIADYYPLTWSLSAYGEPLIANPRGQTIFQWSNVTSTPAQPLANAPAEVTYALVAPGDRRQVMAFGCSEEVSGTFNPVAIRFSDIEDPTDWTTLPTNNAGEVVLDGGGRIVAARAIGDYLHVWTDSKLYLGTFVGAPGQTWRFDQVGDHCGLIGPNAAVVVGQVSYWMSTDAQFFRCTLGGQPQLIECPSWLQIRQTINFTQQDKVVASSISQFGEVRWDFPDLVGPAYEQIVLSVNGFDTLGDGEGFDLAVDEERSTGSENNRYVAVSILDGAWSQGLMSRTAFVDAGPNTNPIGVDPYGIAYYHERGNTADGNELSWSMETADQYIGDASQFIMLKGIWPDFRDQIGPVSLTVLTKKYPQAPERESGPWVLSPDRSKKDFRATGRVARIRISGNAAPSYIRLGKPEFEAEGTGYQ